jgi:hypothetical protein
MQKKRNSCLSHIYQIPAALVKEIRGMEHPCACTEIVGEGPGSIQNMLANEPSTYNSS